VTPGSPAGAGAGRGPQRVRVLGDYFHGRVPAGAVYVGRAAPGLPASRYANPFKTGGLIRDPGPGGGPACPYRGPLAPGMHRDGGYGAEVYEVRLVTSRAAAVALFAAYIPAHGGEWPPAHIRRDLGARDLACWCPLPEPCHADVLLAVSNGWEWPGISPGRLGE